ncbi:DJ-1/PfpI family protein, partial [Candidatus Thioglobus sp.]
NGFEEIEAISIIDICRRGGLDVIVAGVDGKTAMGAHNIPIVTDCLITEINANDLEMIVLPGGWNGTVALAKNKTVQSLLKQMQQDDKLIG